MKNEVLSARIGRKYPLMCIINSYLPAWAVTSDSPKGDFLRVIRSNGSDSYGKFYG